VLVGVVVHMAVGVTSLVGVVEERPSVCPKHHPLTYTATMLTMDGCRSRECFACSIVPTFASAEPGTPLFPRLGVPAIQFPRSDSACPWSRTTSECQTLLLLPPFFSCAT
jgi:hypothetical protein